MTTVQCENDPPSAHLIHACDTLIRDTYMISCLDTSNEAGWPLDRVGVSEMLLVLSA
jgi:hypothetical protein